MGTELELRGQGKRARKESGLVGMIYSSRVTPWEEEEG
jgi:hypothetical protein